VTTTGCALAAAFLVSTTLVIGADTQARALSPVHSPTLTLDLQNMAKISVTVLEEAKLTLTLIYQAAGIHVQWNTATADFTAILRPPPHPEAMRNSRFALGYAPHNPTERGHLAYVLADRTEAMARGLGVPHHLVLGMTMAHEVAHLLLPNNGHSPSGIMRDSWTQSDYKKAGLGQLFFTKEQARLMRDALAAVRLRAPGAPGR